MTPPTHTPGVEPVPGRGTTRPIGVRGAAIRLAIAAVVLVATLVVVLALWNSHRTGSDVAESRDQLRAQAGTIVADVFSVDADRWQQDRTRARERVADEFTDSYGAPARSAPARGDVVGDLAPRGRQHRRGRRRGGGGAAACRGDSTSGRGAGDDRSTHGPGPLRAVGRHMAPRGGGCDRMTVHRNLRVRR